MEGISLGLILIRWNGLLIMTGVFAGCLFASLRAKEIGQDHELALDLLLPLLVWGAIGARMWHIFTPPLSSIQLGLTTRHYLTNGIDLIAFWVGGYGFPGALLGGMFGLLLFSKKYNYPFIQLADWLAPSIALGQSVGRLGDYFNQTLYGLPTDLPWGIFIVPENRLSGYEAFEYYHPLFAYEIILNLANFYVLLRLSKRLPSGGLFLLYLFNYGVIRFLLEFLRLDAALISGWNVNQLFMAGMVIITSVFLYARNKPAQKL